MICKYCKKVIKHYDGELYHDDSLIFPQYCVADPAFGSRLHEPKEETNEVSQAERQDKQGQEQDQ